MNTLEDVHVYFEAKGYLVRPYAHVEADETAIWVVGRRTSAWINGVELQSYKSYWYVVHSGDNWL